MSAAAEEVWLARDGRAEAVIVLGREANATERYAARELQRAVRLISGAELPIATEAQPGRAQLAIGTPATNLLTAAIAERLAFADGAIDELRVLTDGATLHLAGAEPRGALYAVYAWLERLGARWLWPGDDGEFLPRMDSLPLEPLDIRQAASFRYRGYHTTRYDPDTETWMARNKLNFLRSQAGEGIGREGMVRRSEMGFHIIFAYHNIGLDAAALAANPEYAALIGGRRDAARGGNAWICLSNPEARALLAKQVVKWWEDFPAIEIMILYPRDTDRVCECESCRAIGSASDQWHHALADIIARAETTHPGKRYATLAYSAYIAPPKSRPAPVEFIEYCPEQRCCRHLRGDACPVNETGFSGLEAWRAKGIPLIVRGYEFLMFKDGEYTPLLRHIVDQTAWYRDLGIIGFFAEINPAAAGRPDAAVASARRWESHRSAVWLGARRLWQVDLDPAAAAAAFADLAYGPAAPFMLALDGAWEDAWRAAPGHPNSFYRMAASFLDGFITDALLTRTTAGIAEARQALADGGTPRQAVALDLKEAVFDRWRVLAGQAAAVSGTFGEAGGGVGAVLIYENRGNGMPLGIELAKLGYRVARIPRNTAAFLGELAKRPEATVIRLATGDSPGLDGAATADALHIYAEHGGLVLFHGPAQPPEAWRLQVDLGDKKEFADVNAPGFVADGAWVKMPTDLREHLNVRHKPLSGFLPRPDSGWDVLASQPPGSKNTPTPFLLRRNVGDGALYLTSSAFTYGDGFSWQVFGFQWPNMAAALLDNLITAQRRRAANTE